MNRKIIMFGFGILTTVVGFSSAPPAAHAKDLKVAMILWRGETQAEKGFQDGLKGLGYSVQYTRSKARWVRSVRAKRYLTPF